MQITFENVSYRYSIGTPFEKAALHGLSFTIPSGSYVGIIGQTGSGKSTMIQHLSGLIKPTEGNVQVGDWRISADTKVPAQMRKEVGLVFQYPEHQLFEETVAKDVAFGPLNFGATPEEALELGRKALDLVGLPFEEMKDRSPFQLSGGQMRRVAIAGVLAMEPKVLVLDEPTAGLDPAGRKEILDNIYRIHQERQLTTLLVTHSMEEAARYADLLLVMADGKVAMMGEPAVVFAQSDRLREISLDVPASVDFLTKLNGQLPADKRLPACLYREEELLEHLLQRLTQRREGSS